MDYHAFIVASINKIDDSFQKLLSFCRYYLTFYVTPSPRDLKITLVIPDNSDIENESYYGENGFGLWIIVKNKKSGKISVSKQNDPIPFRDKQKDTLKSFFIDENNYLSEKEKKVTPKDINELLSKLANSNDAREYISRFFDQYIRGAGDAIIDYKELQFEEKLIDKKLLQLNTEIKYVMYKDDLYCDINKHLSYKGEDLSFCTDNLDKLWYNYLQNKGFPSIHKKFEALLKQLFPGYRDHFLHSYQNFLLGSYLLDGLFENGYLDKKDIDNISKGWLLASTFHDFAYCIQEYDKWSCEFFREMLNILEPLGSLDLKSHYIENNFSSSIEHILSELEKTLYLPSDTKISILNDLRQFFYYQMTDEKNHAVTSSLTLFKRFEDASKEDFNGIILHAGLSILLHDDDIWQTLIGQKRKTRKKEEKWISDIKENIRDAKPLQSLHFDKCPLSFILLICDNIQDWGRDVTDDKRNQLLMDAGMHLKNITINKEEVKIEIYLNLLGRTKKLLNEKKDVLNMLSGLLISPVPFIIEYWDKIENKRSEFVFKIGGKKTT